jgi:hypothetical protein
MEKKKEIKELAEDSVVAAREPSGHSSIAKKNCMPNA